MDKRLHTFTIAMNHLIYLTTFDEYGSSRSLGIETLAEHADELNRVGIYAARGEWSENSLKLFLNRMKRDYSMEFLMSQCDFELVGRSAWEYYSSTPHEVIVQKKKYSGRRTSKKTVPSYPVEKYEAIEGERWKDIELDDVISEDRKIIKKYKNSSRRKTPKNGFAS